VAIGTNLGAPQTFRASTAKQVLSLISRELGPDAVIRTYRKIQDADGRTWVEATASPGPQGAVPSKNRFLSEVTRWKFGSRALLFPALGIVILAITGVLIWRLGFSNRTANSPPRKTSIAVISFENQTGDASYDYLSKVIPNLLITSLEGSGIFDVASWERLQGLLKQADLEKSEVIDKELGFQLCEKDNIDAIVMGSFSRAGDVFVTDVKVLDVKTRKIRTSASSKGEGEGSILLSQIDELGREISQGIGLFDKSTDGTLTRIADVTTSSMDAYYHYLRGRECYSDENLKAARIFLEKAIQLDPQFAMAQLYLASSLSISGERRAAVKAYEKARSFSTRATEKEKLFIHGLYALTVPQDTDEALRIFTQMATLYPKEKNSHFGLGLTYLYKGLNSAAAEELGRALEMDPYDGKAMSLIAWAYWKQGDDKTAFEYLRKQFAASPGNGQARTVMALMFLEQGKIDEALAKCQEALEVEPDLSPTFEVPYIYALKENYVDAIRLMSRIVQDDKSSYFDISMYHYWIGSLKEAMSDLRRLTDYAIAEGDRPTEANALWVKGWIAYDRNEFDLCRESFKRWLDIYLQDVLPILKSSAAIPHWKAWYSFYLGLVDLKQGDIESAKSRLGEINSRLPDVLPEYKNWTTFYSHFLEAEIALAEGDVPKAVLVGEKSAPMGRWIDRTNCWLFNVPFLGDVLARAYHRNGEIGKAIAEYESFVGFDRKGEEQRLIHPKYYFYLAELYEEKGDKTNAIKHYERFLELWKDADPDIPEVIEAKKRLAQPKVGDGA
jgi:tetratricopeptide (TPR) repeat protein